MRAADDRDLDLPTAGTVPEMGAASTITARGAATALFAALLAVALSM